MAIDPLPDTLNKNIPFKRPELDYNPEMPVGVSDTEAAEAAAELGLKHFTPARTKALTKLGVFSSKQGVVHQGVGRMMVIDDTLQNVLEKLSEVITLTSDDETKIAAAGEVNRIAATLLKSIEQSAEFQREGLINRPDNPKRRSFSAEPIQPVQNNFYAPVTVSAVDGTPAPVEGSESKV